MNFLDKAAESLYAGEKLFEEKKYNSCVNRVYYCIFQNILHKLDLRGNFEEVNKLANQSGQGSHNFTINWYINNDLAHKVSNKEKIRARTCVDSVRDLRHKADYSKEGMNEKIAKRAIRFNKEFIEIIKSK